MEAHMEKELKPQDIQNTISFLDLQDIHKAAFLTFNSIDVQTVQNADGRVVFRVVLDEEVKRVLIDYEGNPEIRLLDFVSALKRLRGRMLDARNEKGHWDGDRYGKNYNK
jgi:hypothetical protein